MVLAVGLVALTGWEKLDPLIAIGVGINIIFTGWRLIQQSTSGLMDSALSQQEHDIILGVLRKYASDDVRFHAVQTRASGRERFVSFHVLVPGAWSVRRGHDLVEEIEHELRESLELLMVQTHLEPLEDPRSWDDVPSGGLGTEI